MAKNEVLRTNIDDFRNENHYFVHDSKGHLVGILPVDFDDFDMLWVVEEYSPDPTPTEQTPDSDVLSYAPGRNWIGTRLTPEEESLLSKRYADWLAGLGQKVQAALDEQLLSGLPIDGVKPGWARGGPITPGILYDISAGPGEELVSYSPKTWIDMKKESDDDDKLE